MEADPEVVFTWLDTNDGGVSYLQVTALEQLCNEILCSDSVVTFRNRFPPERLVPALAQIFLDAEAPIMVLEANARAMSYYLDMHTDFFKYVTETPEIFPALGSRLDCLDMSCPKSNEFGQQLIKLLKILCDNVLTTISTTSLLTSLLRFLCNHTDKLHSDVRQAGFDTMRKLFTRADPALISCHLPVWIQSLADLLECNESGVADQALQAFSNLVSRFAKCGADPTPLASPYIIDHLLRRLRIAGGVDVDSNSNSPTIVQAITNILITLCCCGSTMVLPCLLKSPIPLTRTLAMVLLRTENPSVIRSILRFINIILILLFQSPEFRDSDKKDPMHVDDKNSEFLPFRGFTTGLDDEETDRSTGKTQSDEKTANDHVIDASKPDVQALRSAEMYATRRVPRLRIEGYLSGAPDDNIPAIREADGDICQDNPMNESEISYPEAQHTFVHQLFPVLINLFNETACPAVKHQCILLATRLVTCLTPDCLEEISLTKFNSVTFAFSLTQMVHSVCTEEADEVVLHALKLSRCLLLKAPQIYTVVFRRKGLKPLFDQLGNIWTHLCKGQAGDGGSPLSKTPDSTRSRSNTPSQPPDGEAISSAEPPLPLGGSTPGGGSNLIQVWHSWYMIRLEEQVCVFTQKAIILLQARHRGAQDDRNQTDADRMGLCALALHTGNVENTGEDSPTCASVVLLSNRPMQLRLSLKAKLFAMHRHFLKKITSNQDGVKIINLLSVPQSQAASLEIQSHQRTNRHTESEDYRQSVTSSFPSLLLSSGSGQFGSASNYSHLMGEATLHQAEVHRPAYSPSPDHSARTDLLQRQASSPVRSCLRRNPRKASPVPDGSETPAELNGISVGPFYFCLREAGANGTCLCVQLRRHMNTKNTREAILFFEDDTLGFSRVRISPLQLIDRLDRSRQHSRSEQSVGSIGQEGSANRRYLTSLVDVLSELDKEFNCSTSPEPVDSGEPVSSSLSTWNPGLIDTPESSDLDILFGVNSTAAADDTHPPVVPSEDTGTPSHGRRHNSESSQVIAELQRFSELFPSELVYETYNSGRLTLPLQRSGTLRIRTSSSADKSKRIVDHRKLSKTRCHALRLTLQLSRFLSVPVEKWRRQSSSHHVHNRRRSTDLQWEPVASDPMLHLGQIVADIIAAFQANSYRPRASMLDELSNVFRRLADLLTADGEEAVTAYELTTCGLVPALLLCISVTNAGRWQHWSNVSGLDLETDLLWYLHERRQLFLHSLSISTHQSTDAKLSPLSNLIRRLVQAFELADHLPLCLYALSPQNPRPSRSTDVKWIMPKSQFLDFPEITHLGDLTEGEKKTLPSTHRPLASLPVGVIKAAAMESRRNRQSETGQPAASQSHRDSQQTCIDSGEATVMTSFRLYLQHRFSSSECCPRGLHQINGWLTLSLERLPSYPAGNSGESPSLLIDDAIADNLKLSPLATVGQLRRVLQNTMMQQWYDHPRTCLPYWQQVQSAADEGVHFPSPPLNSTSCPLELLGGIIDWLATNGGLLPLESWSNPAIVGLVSVASSAGRRQSGQPTAILGPRAGSLVSSYPVTCSGIGATTKQKHVQVATSGGGDDAREKSFAAHSKPTVVPAWFAVDLGLQLTPTAYSLAYLRRAEFFQSTLAPRHWRLDASNDAVHWTLLSIHHDDSIQSISGSRATWNLETTPEQQHDDERDTESSTGWRYFRIVSTGPNADGTNVLALGGLEFYGTVHAVHSKVMTPTQLAQHINAELAKAIQSQSPSRVKTKAICRSLKSHALKPVRSQRRGRDRCSQDSKEANEGILGFIKDDESIGQCLEICMSDNNPIPSLLRAIASCETTTDEGTLDDARAALESNSNVPPAQQPGEGSESEEHEVVTTTAVGITRTGSGGQDQDSPPAGIVEGGGGSDANSLRMEYLEALQPTVSDFFEDFGDAIEAIIQNNMSSTASLVQPTAFPVDDRLERWKGVSGNSATLTPTVASDSEVPTMQLRTVVDSSIATPLTQADQFSSSSTKKPTSSSDLPTGQSDTDQKPNHWAPLASKSSGWSGRVQLRRRTRRPRPRPLVDLLMSASGLEPEPAETSLSSASSSLTARTSDTRGSGGQAALTGKACRRHRQPLTWSEMTKNLLLPPGLIPLFDPNPGVTNAAATTPFTLLTGNPSSCSTPLDGSYGDVHANKDQDQLTLVLMAMSESRCVQQVPLMDNECTLFKYVQYLSDLIDAEELDDLDEHLSDSDSKEKTARFSLTLGYRKWHPDDEALLTQMSHHLHSPHSKTGQQTFLSSADLRLTPSLRQPMRYLTACLPEKNARYVITMAEDMASDDYDDDSLTSSDGACHPEKILDLLGILHQLSGASEPVRWHKVVVPLHLSAPGAVNTSLDDFLSPRLSKKLMLQLRDHLAVASGALPDWSLMLTRCLRPLFSFDSRLDFFKACAFGPARAVVWLKNLPDPPSISSPSSPPSLSRQVSKSRNALLAATIAALPRSMRTLLAASSGSAYPIATTGRLDDLPPGSEVERNGEEVVESEECEDGGTTDDYQECCYDSSDLVFMLTTDSSTEAGQHQSSCILTTSEGAGLSPTSVQGTDVADNSLFSSSTLEGESDYLTTSLLQETECNSTVTGPASMSGASGDDPRTSGQLFPLLDESVSSPRMPSEVPAAEAGSAPGANSPWDCAARLMEEQSDRKSGFGAQLFDEDDDEFPLDIFTSLLLATNGNQLVGTSTNRHVRVGRLHKEFVRIPRLSREVLPGDSDTLGGGDRFWDWAARLMEQHARQKSELEIQFLGEDGTGLGPTLEFYSLLLAELRRKSNQMWVTDDDDMGDELQPADAVTPSSAEEQEAIATGDNGYVISAHGLFPAPWPADRVPSRVLHRFYILGITIAKCLQDNRRIDLPLSMPFLKLLSAYGNIPFDRKHCRCRLNPSGNTCSEATSDSDFLSRFSKAAQTERVLTSISNQTERSLWNGGAKDRPEISTFLLTPQYRRVHHTLVNGASELHWTQDLLDMGDLCQVYPDRAYFFHQAMQFCNQRIDRPADTDLEQLSRDIFGSALDGLCLYMEFMPTSKSLVGCPLLERYSWEESSSLAFTASHFSTSKTGSSGPEEQSSMSTSGTTEEEEEQEQLTVHNLDIYLTRMLAFCLDKGIRRQLEAFRAGFELVLPLSWLSLFNPSELSQLICGESLVQWTREDLLAYTIPSFGFTAKSSTYCMLIDVLVKFSVAERRAFLQFTTGCSSLPHGGLKNLHPRLRIVRKDVTSGTTGSAVLPSVNTCVHYLKLPEYESEEDLRSALLRAHLEVGFYLN